MNEYAKAFGFSAWPFRVVVDDQFARVWADRADLKKEIERRFRRLKALPHSTVQLMWADLGAGKSHTLRYLEAKCLDDPASLVMPIYMEIGSDLGGLLGFYRQLTAATSDDLLGRLGGRQQHTTRGPVTQGARDLRQAIRLITGDDLGGRDLAYEWLRAPHGSPHLRTLKAYGISSRIEDDSRALEVMVELVKEVGRAMPGASVLILIDEVQRLADAHPKKRDSVLRALVSLFNSCPSGVHLFMSFSVAQQSTISSLIPPELQSRAATFSLLALPFLSQSDALIFAVDLIAAFQVSPDKAKTFPFAEDALELLVARTYDGAEGRLTPRLLMESLGSVLADLHEQEEAIGLPVTRELVLSALRSPSLRQE